MEELRQKLNELMDIAKNSGFKRYEDDKWYHQSSLKLYKLGDGFNRLFYFGESREEVLEMYLEWYYDRYSLDGNPQKVDAQRERFKEDNDIYYIKEYVPSKGLFFER